ncbi:MAG: response regulator [Anaerolineaceae bacterium]|nr:response regulator [Anaerolineaceae bacterium]
MAEKILIVDDDIETLRLVGLMLQRQGYEIVAANNGSQAIVLARAEFPDLIVLDVMMPDLDGFQVTRQLRSEPQCATIPILMFTAKSQVEDKVAGYEAGVDDYLTKPVHPAELVAKIKGLLTRSKSRATVAPPVAAEKGHMIGVVASKGGIGVSTLVLNLALAYQHKTKGEVIVAELRTGQGSWATELGFTNSDGLTNLLSKNPGEITTSVVEKELFRSTYNIRMLLASNRMKDNQLILATEQLTSIVKNLPSLGNLVILDIGTSYLPGFENVINACDEIILVAEAQPNTVQLTKILLNELNEKGFGKSKFLTTALVNRVRSDVQLSVNQVQESLGVQISVMVPPAPEQAFQAATHYTPLISIQPDGLVAQQFNRLADIINDRIRK